MSTTTYPEFWTGRACAGKDQNLFFPTPGETAVVRKAQAFCADCPVLAQCAAWAAPRVERKKFVECVIGGVQIPPHNATSNEFAAAAQELAEVALLGYLPEAGAEAA